MKTIVRMLERVYLATEAAGSSGQGNTLEQAAGTSFYHVTIIPLVIITVVLAWFARPSTAEELPKGFTKFAAIYLGVWALCAAADWLQGPYVYALYAAYGFPRHQIAQLFVAGFASSLVFSCVTGAVCDRFGRKKCALWYCVFYILSCLTKHFNHFGVLMFGRITGGLATSLLFSCFECWMVSEHTGRKGFSQGLLSYMFGLMYTVNYFVAIFSGIFAELLADGFQFRPSAAGSAIYFGGNLCPFDAAIVCLVVGGLMIMILWGENYGQDQHESETEGPQQGVIANLKDAMTVLVTDRRTFLVGLSVACFEGSMYAFVFNWTPALESATHPPPFGLIFSLYMMACMSGASISTLLDGGLSPSKRLCVVFAMGAGALIIAAAVCDKSMLRLCFAAFVVFEFCVGLYFPSMGVLKSQVVPERVRGTIYNLYRVPLNAVVVVALLTSMTMSQVFIFCACLCACGGLCIGLVHWVIDPPSGKKGGSSDVKFP